MFTFKSPNNEKDLLFDIALFVSFVRWPSVACLSTLPPFFGARDMDAGVLCRFGYDCGAGGDLLGIDR